MIDDRKITETALRMLADRLADFATYDLTSEIDAALCIHHCPPGADCLREHEDFGREIRSVHGEIKHAVLELRGRLGDYAQARGVDPAKLDAAPYEHGRVGEGS